MTLKQLTFHQLWAQGYTYPQIADALGCTKRALYYYRESLGLPRRKRGRKKNHRGNRP